MEIIHPLALIVSRNIIPCLDVFIIEKKKETRKWRGRRQTFIAGANACRAIKNLTDQYQMAFAVADQY
jgi:hypothetical protein